MICTGLIFTNIHKYLSFWLCQNKTI